MFTKEKKKRITIQENNKVIYKWEEVDKYRLRGLK